MPATLTSEETATRRADLDAVFDILYPAVAADGGELRLIDADVETGVVTVELAGACATCAASTITLRAGVERILRDSLGWVTQVNGTVADGDGMW